jgi:acetyl esterase/lipase
MLRCKVHSTMMSTSETQIRADALSLPMRIYRSEATGPAAPVVLHLHGGAFVSGGLDNGRAVASLLAEAGAAVMSVAYPLAPQHRFPEGLEAAFGALEWLNRTRGRLANRKSRVFVAGEEAGANLAAALALMARDRQGPELAGQILLSPMIDPRMATCSMREAAAGPVGCKWADGWHEYLGAPEKAAHPYAAPLGSRRLAGLPPALVVTAEDDLLRDEAVHYVRRLRQAGVEAHEHILAAPTGWPCALHDPQGGAAPWAAAVRDQFKEFFAARPDMSGCCAANRPLHS